MKRNRDKDEVIDASLVPDLSSSSSSSFDVAIVGGGLAGLAAAIALQKEGLSCKVYEKDRCFSDRMQGYGLTLTNNPKGGLAKLGLLEECIEKDCPSNCHWVFDPMGAIIGYFGRLFCGSKPNAGRCKESVYSRGNLRIPRQELRRMLLERLNPETIVWNATLVKYEEVGDKVELMFADGQSTSCDILVGTDGIKSVVRKQRDLAEGVNESMLEYTGISVIIGISTARHSLINEQGFYVLDGTHRMFTMPFKAIDGCTTHTMWQLSFSGWSEQETLDLRVEGRRP